MNGGSGGARKIARNVCGCGLMLLGVVGLALPVIQGVALIAAGFLLLEFEGKQALIARARSHPAGRWLERRWLWLRARLGREGAAGR